jgi:hypothetical protein
MDVIKLKANKTTGIKIVSNIQVPADGKAPMITLGTLSIKPNGKRDVRPSGGIMVEIPGAQITTV